MIREMRERGVQAPPDLCYNEGRDRELQHVTRGPVESMSLESRPGFAERLARPHGRCIPIQYNSSSIR